MKKQKRIHNSHFARGSRVVSTINNFGMIEGEEFVVVDGIKHKDNKIDVRRAMGGIVLRVDQKYLKQ